VGVGARVGAGVGAGVAAGVGARLGAGVAAVEGDGAAVEGCAVAGATEPPGTPLAPGPGETLATGDGAPADPDGPGALVPAPGVGAPDAVKPEEEGLGTTAARVALGPDGAGVTIAVSPQAASNVSAMKQPASKRKESPPWNIRGASPHLESGPGLALDGPRNV
jgi:hypothetical protein